MELPKKTRIMLNDCYVLAGLNPDKEPYNHIALMCRVNTYFAYRIKSKYYTLHPASKAQWREVRGRYKKYLGERGRPIIRHHY